MENISLDPNVLADLAKVNDFDTAMKFIDTYGSDLLEGHFRRYTIRYQTCQVKPLKANTYSNNPVKYEDPENLAQRLLGSYEAHFSFKNQQNGTVRKIFNNLEYLVTFETGTISSPFSAPVNSKYKW